MSARARGALVVVAIAMLAAVAVRLLAHGAPAPAVVTTRMNAHRLLEPDLRARIEHTLRHSPPEDRSRRPRLIALTFDDGPYPLGTPLLLDELHDLGVPATFFYIGRDAQQFPELAGRTARGNEVANHTFSHPNLDQLSDGMVAGEIQRGRSVLSRYVRDPAIGRFFRPPHGRYTEATLDTAQRLGYTTVLWTDDAGDWRTLTPATLSAHIEQHATAPEIVLLHSGRLPTVQMLAALVSRFRAAGYRFVTVGELFKHVRGEDVNHPAKVAL